MLFYRFCTHTCCCWPTTGIAVYDDSLLISINYAEGPSWRHQYAHEGWLPPGQKIFLNTDVAVSPYCVVAASEHAAVATAAGFVATVMTSTRRGTVAVIPPGSHGAATSCVARITRCRLAMKARCAGAKQSRYRGHLLSTSLRLRHLDVSLV